MRHQQQTDVIDKLAQEQRRFLRDRCEKPMSDLVVSGWRSLRDDLGAFAAGAWRQEGAKAGGFAAERARSRILQHVEASLKTYRADTLRTIRETKTTAYGLWFNTAHWILDQVTPPNIVVAPDERRRASYQPVGRIRPVPRSRKARESWFTDAPEGEHAHDEDQQPQPSFEHSVDAWLKAWGASVATGLAMGAITGDTPEDAAHRVEGATANGQLPDHVLNRLIRSQVQIAVADADDDFFADYGQFIQRRVWATMEDERVCPICGSQDGLREEEVDVRMPAHPNCRCWWRMEPMPYQELAGELGMPGAGRSSMVYRDRVTGDPIAAVIVDFDTWAQRML